MSLFTLTPDPAPRPPFTRRGGALAQRAGRTFQDMIEFSAGLQRDVVTLEQLPSLGAKFLGGGKCINTRICIDFIGMINDCNAFYFDAKHCGKDSVGFDANRWHKECEHQAKFLRRMGRAGAVAGLLVRSMERELYLWADIAAVDVLDTVRFARDGRLLSCWTPCGSTNGPVDFTPIKRKYFP